MDAKKTAYMTEFASCWGLLVGSMLVASPVIFFKIKDSTAVEDDLRFSDETAADVFGASNELSEFEQPEQRCTPQPRLSAIPTTSLPQSLMGAIPMYYQRSLGFIHLCTLTLGVTIFCVYEACLFLYLRDS